MALTREELRPELLYRLYAPRIERRIRSILGPDFEREDLTHEVLMTVFRRIGTLRDPACLDAWVDQVTVNTLRYTLRQRRLRRHASWELLPERQAGAVHPNPEACELVSRAAGVIRKLPPGERALLLTTWFSSRTAREIAKTNRCSTVTVARRLFKAKNRFAKLARLDPALAGLF